MTTEEMEEKRNQAIEDIDEILLYNEDIRNDLNKIYNNVFFDIRPNNVKDEESIRNTLDSLSEYIENNIFSGFLGAASLEEYADDINKIIDDNRDVLSDAEIKNYTMVAENMRTDAQSINSLCHTLSQEKDTFLHSIKLQLETYGNPSYQGFEIEEPEKIYAAVKELKNDLSFARPWIEKDAPLQPNSFTIREFMKEAFDAVVPDAHTLWHNTNHFYSADEALSDIMDDLRDEARAYGFTDTSFVNDFQDVFRHYVNEIDSDGLAYSEEGYYPEGYEAILYRAETYDQRHPEQERETPEKKNNIQKEYADD